MRVHHRVHVVASGFPAIRNATGRILRAQLDGHLDRIVERDDHLLDLHRLDAREHGFPTPESGAQRGAGVSLCFEAPDRVAFEGLVAHATASGATVVEAAHWNPQAHHHEATLVDPDGYVVALHSPFDLADDGT